MNVTDATGEVLILCGLRRPQSETSSRNAVLAGEYLQRANRVIQGHGWAENTEDRVELERNVNNEYTDVELNVGGVTTLTVRASGSEQTTLIVKRGSNLWWRDDSISTGSPWTKTFDDDVEVTRIILLPFDQLPDHLADYIVAQASRDAFGSEFVSQISDRFRRRELREEIRINYIEMKSTALSFKNEKRRNNLLNSPGVRDVLGRRRGMRMGT